LASLAPGDEVIVGRDLHQSLLAALILTGARPIYVAPRLHSSLILGSG
jgi:arginine/lysine/ornithine decarboxylase